MCKPLLRPRTCQLPQKVGGETASADGSAKKPIANTEVTLKDGKAEEVAAQAGLSISAGQALRLLLVPDQDNAGETPTDAEKKPPLHPQDSMKAFWKNLDLEYRGLVTQVLPGSLVKQPTESTPDGLKSATTGKSYEEAKAKCIRAVTRIIRECQEHNMKYSDPHFDIESDLKISGKRDCLEGLVPDRNDSALPGDVKRVTDLFENPKFFEDGATSDDITQGTNGDCWFLSALSALCSNEALVRRVCVIQSQLAGVYGFVFHRAPAYEELGDEVVTAFNVIQKDPEQEYTRLFQQGSQALLFAQSSDQNETWVPLLEKAYAKAHGDYATINGGHTGEALEDLTGGVTTEIYTTDILDKDAFWSSELSKVGKDFLFGCGLPTYTNWRHDQSDESDESDESGESDESDRSYVSRAIQAQRHSGIIPGHSYAILATYEGFGKRLVKVRNPWGHVEWNGPWSDGSKEWTEGDGDWAKRLHHKFGDDGVFWMPYDLFLKRYVYIDRTRVFGPEWHISQGWTSVQVPWSTADYHDTTFLIQVPETTEAVIVLSQLDERYFQGLEGKYYFKMQFRVQKNDEDPDVYLARSRLNYELWRSVNVEVELEKGTYTVLMKIEANETDRDDVETVIRNSISRREKVIQLGKSYDLAHQKGRSLLDVGTGLETPVSGLSPAASDFPVAPKTDDPARNPWNAATVVGLRVYSKQPDLAIKVVIPEPEKKDPTENATFDGDDPAKPALDQVDQVATDKIDSIFNAPAEAATATANLPIRV